MITYGEWMTGKRVDDRCPVQPWLQPTMLTFGAWREWQEAISDAVNNAMEACLSQDPQTADGTVNQRLDHYYVVAIPPVAEWQQIKTIIENMLPDFAQNPRFRLYPSDLKVQYMGTNMDDDNTLMQFHIYGSLKREVNDEPGWMPPKGVYSPGQGNSFRLGNNN